MGRMKDLRQETLGPRPVGEWRIFMISVSVGLVFVT